MVYSFDTVDVYKSVDIRDYCILCHENITIRLKVSKYIPINNQNLECVQK